MALLLGLLSAVGPFAIDMYLPALPDVARDLHTSEAGAALTLTAYLVVFERGAPALFVNGLGISNPRVEQAIRAYRANGGGG